MVTARRPISASGGSGDDLPGLIRDRGNSHPGHANHTVPAADGNCFGQAGEAVDDGGELCTGELGQPFQAPPGISAAACLRLRSTSAI